MHVVMLSCLVFDKTGIQFKENVVFFLANFQHMVKIVVYIDWINFVFRKSYLDLHKGEEAFGFTEDFNDELEVSLFMFSKLCVI